MRILVVGAGGVGSSVVPIAARRDFFELVVVADYDAGRAERAVDRLGGDARFAAARIDASSADDVAAPVPGATASPTSSMPSIRDSSCRSSRERSRPAPTTSTWRCRCRIRTRNGRMPRPASSSATSSSRGPTRWPEAGRLALAGIGVEPGLSDVFARYAADHLFSEIDEIGVRDGANLVVEGYDFAPSFSIWTTIEECLNPPVIWERDRGWYTTPPFSEPETFDFPEGIGPVECVNVEHEEVLLIPRWVEAKRVTFKYGLGDEFIEVLSVLHKLGLDRTDKLRVGGVEVSPRDVVAAALPDPATLGDRMRGQDVRRDLGDRDGRGRPASRGLPLPRGRQRMDHAGVRIAGGRLADGDQPGRRARTARRRHVVRGRASSVRRPSTRCRSSSC